jgi:FlaA1/EpsC-like NDP-sugar epimerase
LKAGGPLTVTHPEVTRYFMTVDEACELVVQAGAVGRRGEVLVLDMGTPVRIAEVAERLVSQAKRPVRVEFTGLRAGEKLHEVLLAEGEADNRPIHPLISHVPVPPLDPVDARSLDPWAARQEVVQAVDSLAGQLLPAGSPSLTLRATPSRGPTGQRTSGAPTERCAQRAAAVFRLPPS